MNFSTKITFLMLAASFSFGISSAQDISIEEANKAAALAKTEKDTLPDDAIIVRRIPLASGPELNTDQLVVDTIPSSSEGLNIVLFNDNTWRYIRNRDISVIDETVFTQDWDTVNLSVYKTAQSCPTLCDPMDCSLPGSSVHGILQSRIPEWVAISSSRRSFPLKDQTVSCISKGDSLPLRIKSKI